MRKEIKRQLTPLNQKDCLMVFEWTKDKFDFPIHFHPEFELNFIRNAEGARRICGDHVGTITNDELLLVGPNSYHCWEQGNCNSDSIHETIILFQRDLFHPTLLMRDWMQPISKLLYEAQWGVLFGNNTIDKVSERINELTRTNGFKLLPAFLELLNILAIAPDKHVLSTALPSLTGPKITDDRLTLTYQYIAENYRQKITMQQLANHLSVTPLTLHRHIKRNTGYSIIDLVNQFRISQAVVQLIDTDKNISEIARDCGFFNMAYFNRVFKASKGLTPKEFRRNYFNQ